MKRLENRKPNLLGLLESRIRKWCLDYTIPIDFEEDIKRLTESDIKIEDRFERRDFTADKVFTIDGADCKDMDDALSIKRKKYGYQLMVHIADVSLYVPLGSRLDEEASYRGNSFYTVGNTSVSTIPLLPDILSKELCSLNQGEERNTLSMIIDIDDSGKVLDYKLTKGKIRSEVKGIYKEVNEILDGRATSSIEKKYENVLDEIFLLYELYEILRLKREIRGGVGNFRNKLDVEITDKSIDLFEEKKGKAEGIIEEIMLLSNFLVSDFIIQNRLPGMYRVHKSTEEEASYTPLVNRHACLALGHYTHFTAPIRRIADLKNHQIISEYLGGYSASGLLEIFSENLVDISELATKKSRTAKNIEIGCKKFCIRLYVNEHKDEFFAGDLVNYNFKNEPLFYVKEKGLLVAGSAKLSSVEIGKKYEFQMRVTDKKRVYAYNLKEV